MTQEDPTTPGTESSDLTPEALNKFLVSMKSSIRSARTSIIRRHARLIVKLKTMIKKASAKEDQKSLSATALKNKKKATKLKNEVKTLKNLAENDIGKLVLLNTMDFNTAAREGAGVSAICRMAEQKAMVEHKLRFNKVFGASVSQLPFCVKVLGAERRSRKIRKLKADKKGRMLEYERRLCKLLKEIGGEEFEAAERLYVKVLSMKKSLEKRKKIEKTWAKAQGPLGDRKAAYEEYLKTLKEGDEKETFASYVGKLDALERKNGSPSESSDSPNNDTSMKDPESSDDESVDLKQLELRNKIFENLDAKFGEWDGEDESDISDSDDDVEVTPGEVKSASTNYSAAPVRGQPSGPKSEKNEKKSASPKSSSSSHRTDGTKKRKRDVDESRGEGSDDADCDKSELNRTVKGQKAASVEAPRDADCETTARSRDVQLSREASRVDDKIHPSLFSLFKKTGLATKTLASPAPEKSKRKGPLDQNIKKSLYCDDEKSIQSTSFLTTSASGAVSSFFQGDEEKSITPSNKLFVGNKKKIVAENEAELSEIPEAIAFEKAQKLSRAGLAAECASDDEQEDLSDFNSTFLLKNEGQSLLQHMSLRGGKRSRVRGADARGRGRGFRRGNFSRTDDVDNDDFTGVGGGDVGSSRRKFGGAFFNQGGDDRGRRGDDKGRRGRGGPGAQAQRPSSSRFEDDHESLHPSWAAKKQNSGAIQQFQGKRTVFN